MKKHLLSLLAVAAASVGLLAVGCATRNSSESTLKLVEMPASSFSWLWKADLKLSGDRITELYARDEYVFAYTRDHMSYVFDRPGGILQFSSVACPPQDTLRAPVVITDRIVYPTPASLYVYDRKGKPLPTVNVEFAMRNGCVGYGTRVFYGGDSTHGGRVLAIDLAKNTGSTLASWQYLTRGGLSSTPAYFQGLLYTGCEDGTVSGVNAENGAAIFPMPGMLFMTYGRIVADLKADEFGVYVASEDSKLYCLDRITGKIRWQYFAGIALSRSPWVSPSTVYLPVEGKGLVAIDKVSGPKDRVPKWIAPDAVRFLAEDEKFAYLQRDDNLIVAVDKATGEEKFHSRRKDFTIFASNTENWATGKNGGIIYAATPDGKVYAITPNLRAGNVGEMVLDVRPVPALAMAQR